MSVYKGEKREMQVYRGLRESAAKKLSKKVEKMLKNPLQIFYVSYIIRLLSV